jgi:hypothetical protein
MVQAVVSPGAAPVFAISQAVWFWHSMDGDAALAAGRNSFSGNSVVQLQGPVYAHAQLRGPGGERYVEALQWQALNPGEGLPSRPVRFDPQVVTLGPELVQGGSFSSGLSPWISWQNPVGTGFAVRALSGMAGCTGPCMGLTAGSVGDLLASPPFMLRAGAAYVYRWTASMPANRDATVGVPYISRDAAPWDPMADAQGFMTYASRHGAPGETLSYETYFTAKSADPARVNLQLETLNVPVAFDNVSVREVIAYRAVNPSEWAALAFAAESATRSVGCPELGWPAGCSALGIDGQAVALPITMAPGSQRLLLRADSPLRR